MLWLWVFPLLLHSGRDLSYNPHEESPVGPNGKCRCSQLTGEVSSAGMVLLAAILSGFLIEVLDTARTSLLKSQKWARYVLF
jgi:hypothetical protein